MLSTEQASDAVVKVIDFGTAQVLDSDGNVRIPLSVGRTPEYCPPEVLKKAKIDKVNPTLDMWALGIILYIMLVAAHPFDIEGSASDQVIADRVINNEQIPILCLHLLPITKQRH